MKRKFIPFLGVLAYLASCQSAYDDPAQELPLTFTPIEELTGIQHDIVVNILTNHFGGYTKGKTPTRTSGQFSLTPYIIEGDTVMYIAQYQDGWELYSASHATNMVLFSSETGIFDINAPDMPPQLQFLIQENAAAIKDVITASPTYINASWGSLAVSEEQLEAATVKAHADSEQAIPVPPGSVPPGHWVLIASEKMEVNVNASPRLIKTKWGQAAPWNAYAKWVVDKNDGALKQARAGCAPVAVAQYEYFTHYKDGVPKSSPAKATITSDGLDYTFLLAASNLWDKMAKTRSSFSLGYDEAALLIGGIGRALNTVYGLEGSSTKTYVLHDYINKIYDKVFDAPDFTYDEAKYWIDKGYPVFAYAYAQYKTDGTVADGAHLFLIDGYKEYTSAEKYTYGLVRDPLPPGTVNPWIDDLRDSNGNIIRYAYTKDVIVEREDLKSLQMNWGWDGLSDDVAYFPEDDWVAKEYIFKRYSYYLYVMPK